MFEPDDLLRSGIASARSPTVHVHYHTERNHQGLENRLPQPAPVTALPITLFNADSDSAGCSATTIGPQADECRLSLFGQFGVNNGLARRKQTGDPPINDERRMCERENAGRRSPSPRNGPLSCSTPSAAPSAAI